MRQNRSPGCRMDLSAESSNVANAGPVGADPAH